MFWRSRKQSDFEDEVQAHLELEVDGMVSEGLSPQLPSVMNDRVLITKVTP